MPTRTCRLSAFVEPDLGDRLYSLARDRGCSVTAILEAALNEYLAARPAGTTLSLAPRLPRPPGRPSRFANDAIVDREAQMRKRTGRPLKARAGLP